MKKIWSGVVRYYKLTDKIIWGLCLFSSAFSVLLLAGIWNSGYVQPSRIVVQIIAAGLGCCAMVVISRIDYQTMADLWRFHLPAAYFLVLLTFILGIGRADDMAWLEIPFVGLTFQPSELLKLSFIVTFAYHLQKVEENLNQPGVLIPVLCHAAAPVLLIMLQGDHGSAIVFLFIACGMLFSAGLAWKYILTAGGLTIAALPVIWYGLTWSLELYQQLNARLWRQGQSAGAVVIHHIVTAGTHDEDVMRALERKDVGQAALIAAVKAQMEVSHERKD